MNMLCSFTVYAVCSVTVPSSCDEESSRSLFSPTNMSVKAPSVEQYSVPGLHFSFTDTARRLILKRLTC